MPFNVIVDVAIGLVVLFWVVATTASFVVEAITSFANLRGRALEMFVREMLTATGAAQLSLRQALTWFPRTSPDERPGASLPPGQGPVGLAQLDVTDHPLIRRLGKPGTFISGTDTSPSYIPADLFAKALLDRLRQLFGGALAAADAVRALHAQLPHELRLQAEVPLHKALSKLEGSSAWSELLTTIAAQGDPSEMLDDARQKMPDGPARLALGVVAAKLANPADWAALRANPKVFVDALWQDIEAAAGGRSPSVADLWAIVASGRLPPALAFTLRPLLDAANHDMETFRKALEGWYDSVMDRASGWFRRYAQFMLFVAAFVIAVAFNLDTLSIGRHLIADPQARDAAVRAGETIVRRGDEASMLVQTYAFSATFRDGQWAKPLAVGMSKLQAADAVALRAQPLLLKSGSFVGPMLALQAATLRGEDRCAGKTDGDCAPAEMAKRWAAVQDPLIAALCRDSLTRQEDRAWAAALSDAELLKQIAATPAGTGRCRTQFDLVRAEGKGRLQALDTLWPQVAWYAPLASAAWEVRKASAPGATAPNPHDADAIAAAFSTAMGTAVDAAKIAVQAADDVLSRLPEVRWLGFWEGWKASPGCGALAVVVSLIGWFITAFMASLGAPLWFDLLNKLVNRRIAGPKPEPVAAAGP